jgi:hypothetical protein
MQRRDAAEGVLDGDRRDMQEAGGPLVLWHGSWKEEGKRRRSECDVSGVVSKV